MAHSHILVLLYSAYCGAVGTAVVAAASLDAGDVVWHLSSFSRRIWFPWFRC